MTVDQLVRELYKLQVEAKGHCEVVVWGSLMEDDRPVEELRYIESEDVVKV